MQYSSINYSGRCGMEWLTPELQGLLNLACITSQSDVKMLVLGKIAELRVKS